MLSKLTSRDLRRWLVAGLILPALLFRAAIPAGFMPVFDSQRGLILAICPGVAGIPGYGPQSTAHAHHHPHAGHGGPGKDGDQAAGSHGGMCPFALSSGFALAGTFTADGAFAEATTHEAGEATATLAATRFERAQSARGPPRLDWI